MRHHRTLTYSLAFSFLAYMPVIAQSHTTMAKDTSTAASAKNLQGVTVTAAAPFIIQRADRIILHVSQRTATAGGNVYEALLLTPALTDQQGLQFRGKQVAVYINGKPTRLSGEELKQYLSSMPANTVDQIHVIPQPSAKYEANGGVVIDIILAKNKSYGTNGTLTAGGGLGNYLRHNGGVSINHRNAQLNVYGSYDYLYNQTATRNSAERFFNKGYTVTDEQNIVDRTSAHTLKAGLDYTFNAHSSAGILVRGVVSERNKDIRNHSLAHYHAGGPDAISLVNADNSAAYVTPTVNLYYKLLTGRRGAALTLNADYFSYEKRWNDDFVTTYRDASGQATAPDYYLRNQSPASNRIQSFSGDYTFKAGKIRYETGIKGVFTRTDNNAQWDIQDKGMWQPDKGKTNHFIYQEDIYAAYASAATSIKKIDLQAGIRLEHTAALGHSLTLAQRDSQRYTDLFPNISIGYNKDDKQQFSLSYRKKIERFGFDIVNPFLVYQSQYVYYQGNPAIKPSYSHNLEAGWAYGNEWMAAVSYSYFTAVLAEVYRKGNDDNTIISTYDNVASANQLSTDLTYTKYLLSNKLMSSNTIGGLYAKYNAPDNTGLGSASFGGFVSSNNQYQLASRWQAEMNLFYYSPIIFGAYRFQSQFSMGLGVSANVLQKKATVSLHVTDLFHTNKRRYTVNSYGVYFNNRSMPETRFIKIAFSYRFGNKNVKAAKNKKTGIDDVKRRMES
ncbi:outer membrane beta-barrel family protein [Chitinophaga pendula]|uniref:outer membrane beta-barrel family protein n=1 Tax=Chitinophaga TaxID=79328 RepID=UPI000BAF71BC|nr:MULTISPECIES: outer membrane beta-barrel family protein [Chitinophaga]ASZ10995.1 hypothetical protein CK934_08480 [Chitinophaga sp. MD30]UCJ06014.1 outer membrane beta-barrel family protein [Chitinophaga pendula]